MRTCFSLDKEQRKMLLSGEYRPILTQTKPAGCEPGATYVLTWSHASRGRAEEFTYEIERTPSCYLTVTSVVRHQRTGGWLIRYDVTDLRSPVRFLRASPPVWVPTGDATASEELSAAEESFYTSSRWGAIDELEAVPRDYQKKISKESSTTWHEVRVKRVAAQQKDRWAAKRRRKRRRWLEDAA